MMIGSRRCHLDYRKHEGISGANIWNTATCPQLYHQPFTGFDVKEESKIREILNKNEGMMKSRRKEQNKKEQLTDLKIKRRINRYMWELDCVCVCVWMLVQNWPWNMEGKERLKEEAEGHRRTEGRVNMQQNSHARRGLSWASIARWVTLGTWFQNLRSSYRGLNGVKSSILSRWSPKHMLCQGWILKHGSQGGTSGQDVHSKDRQGARRLWLMVPGRRRWWLLNELFQEWEI